MTTLFLAAFILSEHRGISVAPITSQHRRDHALDPSYTQIAFSADVLPIVAPASVQPVALEEAAWIIERMTSNQPQLLESASIVRAKVCILAIDQEISDSPEFPGIKRVAAWYDYRARSLANTEAATVVIAEEALLNTGSSDRNSSTDLIHEFSHVLEESVLRSLFPKFGDRLRAAFRSDAAKETWSRTYAATNVHEYWAVGTEAWFRHRSIVNKHPVNGEQVNVHLRNELKLADSQLAALLELVYGDAEWRYTSVYRRRNEMHWAKVDRTKLPRHFHSEAVKQRYAWVLSPTTAATGALAKLGLATSTLTSEKIVSSRRPGEVEFFGLFVNRCADPISLWCVHHNGSLERVETIQPRGGAEVHDFSGRVWEVRDNRGHSLGRVMPTTDCRIVIDP